MRLRVGFESRRRRPNRLRVQPGDSGAPGPHPAIIISPVAAQPLEAGGTGVAGKILQPDLADFECLGMSIGKPAVASFAVAVDGALRIVLVITQVRGDAPIKGLLVGHLDPVVRIIIHDIGDQARVRKWDFLNRILKLGKPGPPGA